MTDPSYVPGHGRRAALRQRRRHRRRLLTVVALAVALVVTAVVALVLVRETPDPPSPVDEQVRTQETLLMQVRGPDGSALASALLAHDPASGAGAVVLVPPQVIVDVPGAGSVPFGQALAQGAPDGPRTALADLLGVQVDATWVLDVTALVALVDQVGGITATVDVPVVQDGQVVVPQGEQRLVRLARLQEVLDGLVTALPADESAVAQLLSGLGDGSRYSVSAQAVARVLVGLQQSGAAQALQYDILPVIPIDPGGGVTAFRIDAEAARALVDRVLAQSVPAGARQTGNRVLVLNGVGTPGLGEAVRAKLVANDFVFVASRNAERFGYEQTQVLVPEATPEAQALGERVAEALGVEARVQQADLGTLADAVVIVGADFVP